ncbi:42094_t:CDS:10, partial [Gigaspora margarita]
LVAMSEIKEELTKMNSDISDFTGASTPPPLDKVRKRVVQNVSHVASLRFTFSSFDLETFSTDSPSFLSTDSSVHTPTDESIVTDHMRKEEAKLVNESEKENLKVLKEKAVADYDALVDKQRVQRLKFLLEKSSLYAQFLANKMERQQEEQRERAQAEEARRANAKEKEVRIKSGPTRRSSRISAKSADTVSTESPAKSVTKKRSNVGKKRKVNDANYNISDYLDNQEVPKRRKSSESLTDPPISTVKVDDLEPNLVISARQPRLVTGGVLREYQLTGVEWLVSLYDNGLNGILADEMGLGKTLQTIAFLAYLWERKIYGPFLIVAPLSTLANWISEIHRFSPTIPCVLYHGTPEQRSHIRSRKLKKLDHTFPIVVTSYEIAMNDRKYLQKFAWKYIVVDEGHRIKNLNCKLIRELKTYQSANRLLLTGTPLQNNLAELWSLLNFLLPDIFDDLDSFQDWFDFSALHEQDGETQILAREQSNEVISNLHKILKPFLLRRIKSDVEYDLPKKKEYLLYAPLTLQQKELYDAILNRNIRPFLLAKKMGSIHENGSTDMEIDDIAINVILSCYPETEQIKSPSEEEVNNCTNEERVEEQAEDRKQTLRALQRKTYREIEDEEFFDALEMEELEPEVDEEEALKNSIKNELEVKTRKAVKSINSMRLQNVVMQLRKICNHPYLFDWPVDKETDLPKVTEELAAASGKMILLESLLESLFERGHKVLIFSQFTTMLDIIDDWATLFKGWKLCRIDGSIGQEDRRQQIHDFNTNPEIRLFILSTRAGGLAQDRVHRIGQTKPVIIYRLVTANTVEGKILEKATAKRKLEKLVIHKGKFKLPTSRDLPIANLAELAEILMADDSEKFQLAQHGDDVIPESDLIRLMDRSDAAFEKLGTEEAQEEKGVMFKVISEIRDANNDALAQITW